MWTRGKARVKLGQFEATEEDLRNEGLFRRAAWNSTQKALVVLTGWSRRRVGIGVGFGVWGLGGVVCSVRWCRWRLWGVSVLRVRVSCGGGPWCRA